MADHPTESNFRVADESALEKKELNAKCPDGRVDPTSFSAVPVG